MKKAKSTVTPQLKEVKEKPEQEVAESPKEVKKEHIAENAHMMEQRLLKEVQ